MSEEPVWGTQQVLSLIRHVEEFFEEFYDRVKKKKVIWQEISEKMKEDGFIFSGSDCDKKWRSLKTSYIRVLQRHIRGDTGHRFEYFDMLHPILGKEIDPTGLGNVSSNNSLSLSVDNENTGYRYEEITVDDGFVWVHSAVNLLLDLIMEFFRAVPSLCTFQEKWEEISKQMGKEGFDVTSMQCQRKWENLQDGFYYHKTVASGPASGSSWPYFKQVKDLMTALKIPTTDQCNFKTPSNVIGDKREKSYDIRIREETQTGGHCSLPGIAMSSSEDKCDSYGSIIHRLNYIEEQVEEVELQRQAYHQTNNLLTQVVSDLRSINQMIESENSYKYRYPRQQHEHIPLSESPNEGIIIVEDTSHQT